MEGKIRSTDPLSPEEERLALRLPPGFEAQLFAAEPDIGKPMNMSFDARGRMWVTQSYEYPFPDTTGTGKDKISILEDTDGDGTADKVTVFADSLNIPIGIQVAPKGVIVYSIPNIWYLIDHDGDDRVDERRVLYSGFQYNDTHGMVNNFVRSWDGWIHADHGFSNTSRVAGADGDTIEMFSGNTFRFRMDGSRVEFTTTGRVNPFGYAYDELGYTYSVDCHTSPVYQLVRGADYPHFGKQPTGIGFGPALMQHEYGSTALAGLEYYIADHFPKAFQRNFYYGDVVLSRVSRSNFTMRGTTPGINQEEDFIVSDDPWFRPVDVKLGPDGALYIADFYNRIIGHYEVPLDHPGRDRQRGRIWRIVYTGEGAKPPVALDFSAFTLSELIDRLDHPNLPLRMSVADRIVDEFGASAIPPVKDILTKDGFAYAKIQALWILYRLDGLDLAVLQSALTHANDTIQTHALRILFEQKEVVASLLEIVETLLKHESPHVRRQAVMVTGQHPSASRVPLLLDLLQETDPEDTHFYYSIRQALRDQFRDRSVLAWVNAQSWEEADARLVADVMVGVDEPASGQFLLKHLDQFSEPPETRKRYVKHAARRLPTSQLERLVAVLESAGENNPDEEYPLFLAMLSGAEQGGKELGPAGRAWAKRLATAFLADPVGAYASWRTRPIDRKPYRGNTWRIVDSTGGKSTSGNRFLASGPVDGQGNGVSAMHSPVFTMPESFSFMLLGQKNPPGEGRQPTPPENRVELVLRSSGAVLKSADVREPEMNEKISWRGNENTGSEVYLRIVDGSAAWGEFVALGALDPALVSLPALSPERCVDRQRFAARMAAEYRIGELAPALRQLVNAGVADVDVRNAAVRALITLDDPELIPAVERQLQEAGMPLKLKELWLVSLSEQNRARPLLLSYLSEIPYESQKQVVMNLSNTQEGIEDLLGAGEEMNLNPQLLLEPQMAERLQSRMSADQQNKYTQLAASVELPSADIDALIDERLSGFSAADYAADQGKTHFSVYCGICHQVSGEGGNIGPQLDGIGNWGARALAEKILAPNRTISRAFTQYIITLKDGTVRTGLFRREAGQTLVFADVQGQEFSIDKSEIENREKSALTLMPDYFRETIPGEEFRELLAYLLSLK